MPTDRLQEIRARLDALTSPPPWRYLENRGILPADGDRDIARPGWYPSDGRFIAHAPADIAWLLDEVERLRDFQQRNNPWWRRDADGSLWAAPPTTDGAPEPDSTKWVRVQ